MQRTQDSSGPSGARQDRITFVGYGRLGSNTNMGNDMNVPTEEEVEELRLVMVASRPGDWPDPLTAFAVYVTARKALSEATG
jgi:hypothetical protein